MYKFDKDEFGRKIRLQRENLGWTQSELAKKLGITKGAISTYELGHSVPSADVIFSLTKALHVSADYLLGITETTAIEVNGLSDENIAFVQQLIAKLKD